MAEEEGDWLREAEGDQMALSFFKKYYPHTSPELYVARHTVGLGCFGFHLMRYRDPELGRWVKRVGELLENPKEVERVRRKLLSREELARIRQEQADIQAYGL